MSYNKYIKRGNKIYGPYIYKSKRSGGKVLTEYVGKGEERVQKKNKLNPLWLIISVAIISITLLLIFKFPMPTAKVALELPSSFQINETITGKLNLNMKYGELIPKDTLLSIKLNEQVKVVPVSEIVSVSETNGNYYIENAALSGNGSGYGFIGEKKSYPEISFQLIIYEGQKEETKVENITGEKVEENVRRQEETRRQAAVGQHQPVATQRPENLKFQELLSFHRLGESKFEQIAGQDSIAVEEELVDIDVGVGPNQGRIRTVG